jgi:hypothetical protein
MSEEAIAPILVQDILKMPADSQVYAFQGTVQNRYDYRTGTGDFGPYSYEDFNFMDSQMGKIKVTFKDMPKLPEHVVKGSEVYLCCVQHAKTKAWHGIKAKDDIYKGVTKRILSVTGTATIKVFQNAPQTPPPARNQPLPPTAQGASGLEDVDPSLAPPQDGLKELIKFVAKFSNLERLAIRAVNRLSDEHAAAFGTPLPDAQKQGLVGMIVIAADRQGFVRDLPCNPVSIKVAKPSSQAQEPSTPTEEQPE